MKKHSFLLSAIILTLGGFFAKAIGAIYKIPLTNILGSSGMGIYYLVFPIYSLAITICSSGISVALTIEVAKCRKIKHRFNEQKLLRVALVLSFLISLMFTILIIILSKPLAIAQGNINAWIGYIAIAPSIIISSIISTLRGYFQGIENMIPTTISLIIEQVIKLSVGLVLAHKLCIYGINFAVLGAILGVTISEVVALIIISINFLIYKGQKHYNYRNLNYKPKKRIDVLKTLKTPIQNLKNGVVANKYFKISKDRKRYTTKEAIFKILKLSLPSTITSLILPIATMLDSFMIINLLISCGYTSHVSTILYGLSGGVVQSLISVPIIIITAISTSLVPSLSGLVSQNDTNELKHKIEFFIKTTLILSIIIFVIFFVFAEDILLFLYGNGLDASVIDELKYATNLLKFGSVSIIYYSFLQTFISIYQAIGKAGVPFGALLISLVVRTILVYLLTKISYINIFGVMIANSVFLALTNIILAIILKRNIDINYSLYRHLLKPILLGAILLVVAEISRWCLRDVLGYFLTMFIVSAIIFAMYLFMIYFGKVLTQKECKFLRFNGRKSNKNSDKVKESG